ncbi:metalloregulator ArsR/SmtB family transcription factor [Herbiconiux sp. CPCC 203407]|uniref:Metalloregulator ArsR/SmtB family transcription factor n=1 Tax=Herbiconiux oxytropis TaxID=2970915 RepID=A0AA41XDN5_9MICO|nr:metalloregulator ArsR/SmtB family transcription factor [Herbiconiux oxytropis]MCS5721294.1 metalloregulator ArsR/SmtB family transcription factor [Herbiconiux oxytropis]MCS5726267.1 metalloregulator ArsR/SmtB family transcription factor [Herbiconiux oxytropis]
MAQYAERLDEVFHALSDPTRRAVVRRLGTGPASVGELAEPFEMALTSFLKHIRVLETSGCIRTVKRGRVRECVLEPHAFAAVDGWLAEERAVWESRTDRLERFVLSGTDDEREDGS